MDIECILARFLNLVGRSLFLPHEDVGFRPTKGGQTRLSLSWEFGFEIQKTPVGYSIYNSCCDEVVETIFSRVDGKEEKGSLLRNTKRSRHAQRRVKAYSLNERVRKWEILKQADLGLCFSWFGYHSPIVAEASHLSCLSISFLICYFGRILLITTQNPGFSNILLLMFLFVCESISELKELKVL